MRYCTSWHIDWYKIGSHFTLWNVAVYSIIKGVSCIDIVKQRHLQTKWWECNYSHFPFWIGTGWHKKTVITKNRIISKILFRLTQNVNYIRSSLCSRHLQSFKSVLQKLFVSLALKKCAPNELPGAAGTFGSGGQSSRWLSSIPPLGSLLLLLWLLPSVQG